MYYNAFIIGFIGSIHCLTMCGPLSMLFSLKGKSFKGIISSLLYQFARVGVYAALGGCIGWLMGGSSWLGISQNVSIVVGVLFVILALVYLFLKPAGLELSWLGKKITKSYGAVVSSKKLGVLKFLLAGALNGLLPCGLVYVALSGAVLMPSSKTGAVYMMVFGLGTIPAMLFTSVLSTFVKENFGFLKLKYITTVFLIFSGSLLILRGMNLGIPYVSPDFLNHQKSSYCEVK